MGVSAVVNRVAYAGNGSNQNFSFPYYFFKQTDLLVYKWNSITNVLSGPYILNTDYTISGTPNAQGLYPNGASVNFAVIVPSVTDIVIVIRAPSQLQTYALGQGGQISSIALVNQIDYLTLLVQRLNDLATRSIRLKDGFGGTFDPTLPTDIPAQPGSTIAVNANGNGLTWGPAVSQIITTTQLAAETPAGTVDGVNAVFNLAHTPLVPAILSLFVDGLMQRLNIDYNIAGPTITFVAAPAVNSILWGTYRY